MSVVKPQDSEQEGQSLSEMHMMCSLSKWFYFRELNKVAPEVNKGKIVLQNFTREGGQSLNPSSIGPDGVESLSKSDMSVTSQDAMTTVIYKKDQMGDMPMMEESKGQENVHVDVGDDDLIFIEGNKDIS